MITENSCKYSVILILWAGIYLALREFINMPIVHSVWVSGVFLVAILLLDLFCDSDKWERLNHNR